MSKVTPQLTEPVQKIVSEVKLILQADHLEVSSLFHGSSHDVFVLTSVPNGPKWSLRIAKDEFASSMARRSITIMNHITGMRPKLPIPAVSYSAESYVVLGYIEGEAIGSWNSQFLSEERRHKVLGGLAKFLYQLWTCPIPAVESAIPTKTYRAWLLDEVDQAVGRSIQNPGWGHPIRFLQRRAEVDGLIPHKCRSGLAIRHGDLNALNVLVNNDELSGVIDWDTSSFVPLVAAVQHPMFTADVPGICLDNVPKGMEFGHDRAYLEDSMRGLSTDASYFAALLASSRKRQFFELSLRNKRVNEQYVRLRLEDVEIDKDVLVVQLDQYLLTNVQMMMHPTILDLRMTLLGTEQIEKVS